MKTPTTNTDLHLVIAQKSELSLNN